MSSRINGVNKSHAFQRTMRALLVCLKCRKPQFHWYHSMQAVQTKENRPLYYPVQNVMYECAGCSTLRVWGQERQETHETQW